MESAKDETTEEVKENGDGDAAEQTIDEAMAEGSDVCEFEMFSLNTVHFNLVGMFLTSFLKDLTFNFSVEFPVKPNRSEMNLTNMIFSVESTGRSWTRRWRRHKKGRKEKEEKTNVVMAEVGWTSSRYELILNWCEVVDFVFDEKKRTHFQVQN